MNFVGYCPRDAKCHLHENKKEEEEEKSLINFIFYHFSSADGREHIFRSVSVMTNYSIKKFKIAHLIFAFTEKMFLK
jgi:hypothetical protein